MRFLGKDLIAYILSFRYTVGDIIKFGDERLFEYLYPFKGWNQGEIIGNFVSTSFYYHDMNRLTQWLSNNRNEYIDSIQIMNRGNQKRGMVIYLYFTDINQFNTLYESMTTKNQMEIDYLLRNNFRSNLLTYF